jgi:cytochrome c oxidase subunit 3
MLDEDVPVRTDQGLVMLEEQYVDLEQQQEAYKMGMWAFLGSELMLFGGLFLAYTVGRETHFPAFVRGSHELDKLLGGLNTAILLTSSTTMAMAIDRARQRRWSAVTGFLRVTAVLGILFLGIKLHEWTTDYHNHRIPGPSYGDWDRGTELFYWLYFVMTGLHALHLTIGLAAVFIVGWMVRRRSPIVLAEALNQEGNPPPGAEAPSLIEILGLYWHLIDLVWIFLYPALYLIGG